MKKKYIQTVVRPGDDFRPPRLKYHPVVSCYYGDREIVTARGVRGIEERWLASLRLPLSTVNGNFVRAWGPDREAFEILKLVALGRADAVNPDLIPSGRCRCGAALRPFNRRCRCRCRA